MKRSKKEIFGIFLRCAIAMTLFVIAIYYYDELSTLDVTAFAAATDNIALKALLVLVVYIIKALTFVVPASVVYVAVGGIFPHFFAVVLNLTGIFIEVTVTYFLGRYLGKAAVEKILAKHEKGQRFLKKNVQNKGSVILGIRAVPAFPIDFVSLFYGASGVGYIKYAALSVLGISWRVIAFTILGSAIFDWIPLDKIILIAICCIPIGVIVYLLKKFVFEPRKAAKNSPANKTKTISTGRPSDEV